jgi:hypothetical protein
MKITLVRTGGLIPVTKAVETEVEIGEEELESLLDKIEAGTAEPRVPDGNTWQMGYGKRNVTIDPGKIPEEYYMLFEKLKSEMKFVK